MMNTIEMFSGLGDVKIEGIEVIAVKYKNICEQAKKKNYDILDHRKAEVKLEIGPLGYKSFFHAQLS